MPARRWGYAAYFFAAGAVYFLAIGTWSAFAQLWPEAIAQWCGAFAWGMAARWAYHARSLAWAVDALTVVIGAQERTTGVTYAVVRTRHPDHYLLHNLGDGSRWRLGENGQWKREDW